MGCKSSTFSHPHISSTNLFLVCFSIPLNSERGSWRTWNYTSNYLLLLHCWWIFIGLQAYMCEPFKKHHEFSKWCPSWKPKSEWRLSFLMKQPPSSLWQPEEMSEGHLVLDLMEDMLFKLWNILPVRWFDNSRHPCITGLYCHNGPVSLRGLKTCSYLYGMRRPAVQKGGRRGIECVRGWHGGRDLSKSFESHT